ncbi:MAG: hypothetical protein ACJ8AT_11990 [Hyalangium sp.]|uniref:hypothetical protein n=1 Tax=Hyalangium sp. TaxID=2028555 RepID=UPI0038999197
MVSLLPALLTSVVLASSPAIHYSSQLRLESMVRTPNLTETANALLISDVLLTPRGQVILFTPRVEIKAILEPQLLLRRAFTQPTLEVLTFAFLRGEYQAARGLKVWAMEATTYGTFPFEDFRVPAPTDSGGRRLLDASKYIYSENVVGIDIVGIRRTYIGVQGGVVINGLLDPPTAPTVPHVPRTPADGPLPLDQRTTPAQVGPEVRAQGFHSLTRRLTLGLDFYGRDVFFSTDAHLLLAQTSPLVQYQFSPLIQGKLQLGLAAGERRPQITEQPPETSSILHPIGEASLETPVPVGYHWPVKAKLAARYVPYVDVYSTLVYPRFEESLGLEWVGRRKAQLNLELTAAQAMTQGPHQRDGEERLSAKFQWPLTRSTAVVASGRLLRLREFLIENEPIYKWFMGVGLVIRQENGRL